VNAFQRDYRQRNLDHVRAVKRAAYQRRKVPAPPTSAFKAAVICFRDGGLDHTQWTIHPSRADAEAALKEPCEWPSCIGSHGVACLDRYARRRVMTEKARLGAVDRAIDAAIVARRAL
jgi:hypothetical protein